VHLAGNFHPVVFKTHSVFAPRHVVHSGDRVSTRRSCPAVGRPLLWCIRAVNRARLSRRATSRTHCRVVDAPARLCVRSAE
jgi:hypothetical protein